MAVRLSCGYLRNGWKVHVPGHTESCPDFQEPAPSLPWDHPDSDPLGDINALLDREISHQANPLLREGLRRIKEFWTP